MQISVKIHDDTKKDKILNNVNGTDSPIDEIKKKKTNKRTELQCPPRCSYQIFPNGITHYSSYPRYYW